MKPHIIISGAATLAVALLAVFSCGARRKAATVRSVYYWSTTFRLDSMEADFLKRHDVKRMYVRFFDVVVDGEGRSVPNATLRFDSSMPRGVDIVPTVFVMPECMNGDRRELARNIVRRVGQMCSTNDVAGVGEIQIDCDWTLSTRKAYNDFMGLMLKECHARGLRLSSTIRLHQLAQTPPPADRGVLMMYNTGDVKSAKCRNPILDMADAAPYMRHLDSYRLPLSVAYPMFSWRLLYRGGKVVGIVHYDGEYPSLAGDSIALCQPAANDIARAVRAVGSHRPDACGEIVLFDLSDANIRRFNTMNYEEILDF